MYNHTNEPFIPQSRTARFGQRVVAFLDRYLTPISIAVVVIGLGLVIAGPVREMVAGKTSLAGDGGAASGGSTGSGGVSVDAGSPLLGFRLDRELAPYTIIPDRPRGEVTTYTIGPGDTLFGIADTFGLDPNTIFWANSDTLGDSVHMIQAGIELFILPVDGVYYRADGVRTLQWIADTYKANVEDIIESPYNELEAASPADIPGWGTRIVVPGGEREIVDWRPPIVETTSSTGQVTRAFMPGMAGSCAAGIGGGGGTGAWVPPLASYSVTQPFYPGHSGIDLAAPVGTPVTAADTGVVIFSGWVNPDWYYGILVVLDHGNGWTTYYAHLSATGVSCGQSVPRGGYLGAVGSTGQSSGPHVHFEMRWAHTPDNPAAYIGF